MTDSGEPRGRPSKVGKTTTRLVQLVDRVSILSLLDTNKETSC